MAMNKFNNADGFGLLPAISCCQNYERFADFSGFRIWVNPLVHKPTLDDYYCYIIRKETKILVTVIS